MARSEESTNLRELGFVCKPSAKHKKMDENNDTLHNNLALGNEARKKI